MSWFLALILSVLATLAVPTAVLANGDGVHFGEFHIPLIVVWIGLGAIVAVFLILFASWMVSRKSAGRRAKK